MTFMAAVGPAAIDVPVETGTKCIGTSIFWVQEASVHSSRQDGPFAPSEALLSCSMNSVSATYLIWQSA
jgi:hypothetical protein